ncbi:SgrR family transcriptional regulator [Veronia pacifica]|uniref:ABC transporter substrate-binding protein n=1 Tax=Veronia pacifica TaxID=1080227 RepID=A0A1C3EKM8_9GAMM|nr:SgrR family transcriptional regulator [Veronia pacifica]ODA33780.1 ABC transporter substrate-binding protein [Veronia pacifica]
MSSQRLQSQFARVYGHFGGKDSETTLQDMSAILECTRRNARMVLNKMAETGWITWQPAVGRGKLSRLIFHRSTSDLQQKRLRQWISEGKLDAAFDALNHDAGKLALLIQELLGSSTREGKQIIRLPYYRPFYCLNPAKPLRRSENHLIRQIFNGLTRVNDKTERVEPDLAHHWQKITERHWRFFIRPSVYFHDGKPLQVRDIIWSLESLRNHTYFSHIDRVNSPAINVIDVFLTIADHRFADSLALPMASIRSREASATKNADRFPVGTGAYKVAENTDRKLVLEAHDQYFGFRALTDTVEIWVLDNTAMCQLHPSASLHPGALDTRRGTFSNMTGKRMVLDEGSNFLLLNRRSGIAKDPRWAAFFQYRLSPAHMLPLLEASGAAEYRLTPAYGLRPGWAHTPAVLPEIDTPGPTTIYLGYQGSHPLYPIMGKVIKTILARDNINVEFIVLEHEQIQSGKDLKKIDIWLGGVSLGSKRSDALLQWVFCFGLFSAMMPEREYEATMREVDKSRSNDTEDSYYDESLARTLVDTRQLLPLFHIWLGVIDDSELQDFSSNTVGWFDFKSVWTKPSDNDLEV